MSSEPAEERTLYGFWLSPYMSQVAHILTESGLAYRYERVSPFQGSTLSPEHRVRNPLGKIPSLRDINGADIVESQAICRYLARVYPVVRKFYPIDDAVLCAQVDAKNDFITFSLGGPFFNWFVMSGYLPKAWRLNVESEADTFSRCSGFLVHGSLLRLVGASDMDPFLFGKEPFLPDFQLFHLLELSQTFSEIFEIPMMNLLGNNTALQEFYSAMRERSSTREILSAQASELDATKRELFGEFGEAYLKVVDRQMLGAIFGHAV